MGLSLQIFPSYFCDIDPFSRIEGTMEWKALMATTEYKNSLHKAQIKRKCW